MESYNKDHPNVNVDVLQRMGELERWFRIHDAHIRVLERERQKFSAVVNHTDAGFLVVDSSLQVVWANKIFTKRFNMLNHYHHLQGVKCNKLLCSQTDICDMCPCAKAFSSDCVAHHEYRIEINGKPHHIYATAMPIKSPEGKTDEAIIMLQDITDLEVLRVSEEKLRASEERFRSIFEKTAAGMATLSVNGRLLQVNPAFCKLLGFGKAQLLKMKIADITHPDDLKETRRQFNEIIAGGRQVIELERRYIRNDSEIVWGQTTEAWLFNSNRKPTYAVVLVQDITERKRAEEEKKKLEAQLRQSQKMQAIGTLAGGIAHDFNNILWVIMGNTEMSLRKLPDDSPIRAKQQEILTASKRAKDLVEQILTFSRQKEQERKPLQIYLIVKETLKLLEATLPSTTKIRQNIDKDCGTVLADPTQLHQMIMNVCTNAYQSMGENGGLLEVSLGILNINSKTIKSYPELQKGSYIELIISDTGCGMDKATIERIFEPFFTTKEIGAGTGLGLATVHGIVTSLGGSIKVYSEPGEGSTFHVFLPRHESSESEEPMVQSNSPVLKGNEHILIIDDEEQVVSMVQDMLQELGYHITTQTSSVEALKQFSAQPDKFDLVITDQTMPDMTGIDLADQILHIRPDIPVILATGYSKLVTEEKIKNIGIRESLMKPIVFHDLEKVVRRVLDDNKDND